LKNFLAPSTRLLLETPGRHMSLISDRTKQLKTKGGGMHKINTLLASVVLATGLSLAFGQEPDNTKMNKQEQPTADQAKNSKTDLKLQRQIRREIVKDKTLSTYAHNIKVIAHEGKVTLRGPVKSDAEKTAIEQKATEIAGAGNVTNELTVKESGGQ
jgi:hyperosmotically inducible periplasmic protein